MKIRYLISDLCALLADWAGYRRDVIHINMARSFPNADYKELVHLRREYYRHIFDLAVESIWVVFVSQKKLCEHVTMSNPELPDALSQKYDKMLFVMGHTGNWELIGAIAGNGKSDRNNKFTDRKLYFTYKKAKNRFVNKLLKKIRYSAFKKSASVGDIVEVKEALFEFVSQRNNGEKANYFIIADQSPKGNYVTVDFLNQKSAFFKGAEYLSKKLNIPLVYMSMSRTSRGKYQIAFELIEEFPAMCPDGELTKRFAELLQNDIMENKVNWLWSHKRWKTRF